jgi:hypothetical protein
MIAWRSKFSLVTVPEGKVISTDISTICDRQGLGWLCSCGAPGWGVPTDLCGDAWEKLDNGVLGW